MAPSNHIAAATGPSPSAPVPRPHRFSSDRHSLLAPFLRGSSVGCVDFRQYRDALYQFLPTLSRYPFDSWVSHGCALTNVSCLVQTAKLNGESYRRTSGSLEFPPGPQTS